MSEFDRTDLVCRAHRERLSPDDQREFTRALQGSMEARLLNLALTELDRESLVQRGDEDIVARIANQTSRNVRMRTRVTRPSLLLAAVALLGAGVATGAFLGADSRKSSDGSPTASAYPLAGSAVPSCGPKVAPPTSPEPVEHPESSEPALAESQIRSTTSSGELARAVTITTNRAVEADPPSASPDVESTFVQANRLRRQNQFEPAIRAYRSIVDGFPATPQAQLSRMALAKLLSPADPNQALAYYESVISHGGHLRAEALWGKAEVARRLGRGNVERDALSALARDFPQTPYAEVARKRLKDASP